MRAMVIERFGGSQEFHEIDRLVPQPGPGQVLIRMAMPRAASA